MSPEEFDVMIKAKRSEALDYCRALEQAFEVVITHATKQRDAATDMRRAIEAVSKGDETDPYDD